VIGFTKSLASEVAPYNIRVNAVAPGFISTEMTSELGEKTREKYLKMIPLKRFGTSDEVAQVVLFLLSDGHGISRDKRFSLTAGWECNRSNFFLNLSW